MKKTFAILGYLLIAVALIAWYFGLMPVNASQFIHGLLNPEDETFFKVAPSNEGDILCAVIFAIGIIVVLISRLLSKKLK